jgi:hypothetical protein
MEEQEMNLEIDQPLSVHRKSEQLTAHHLGHLERGEDEPIT